MAHKRVWLLAVCINITSELARHACKGSAASAPTQQPVQPPGCSSRSSGHILMLTGWQGTWQAATLSRPCRQQSAGRGTSTHRVAAEVSTGCRPGRQCDQLSPPLLGRRGRAGAAGADSRLA